MQARESRHRAATLDLKYQLESAHQKAVEHEDCIARSHYKIVKVRTVLIRCVVSVIVMIAMSAMSLAGVNVFISHAFTCPVCVLCPSPQLRGFSAELVMFRGIR